MSHKHCVDLKAPTFIAENMPVYALNFKKIGAAPPFAMTIFYVESNVATPLDVHQEAECWLILQGEGMVSINGEKFGAKPLNSFYFPPECSHQIENHGHETMIVASIYW